MTERWINEKNNFNCKYVIDGASGYLAYKLAKILAKKDKNKIILIGRKTEAEYKRKDLLKNSNISYYEDYKFVPNEYKKNAILIHTASSTPNNNNKGDDDIFKENNLLRKKVLNHIRESEYKLIINISSFSVYGKITNSFVYPTHQTLPISLYGLSKLISEKQISLASEFSSISNLLHLRLPGIISKESKGIFITKLIKKIKENKPINVKSENSLFNNSTTCQDIANTIINFVESYQNLPKEIIINMCSKDQLKLQEIIIHLSKQLNKKVPEIISDKNISTFLIKNKEEYNILKNSLLKEMFNEILEVC